MDIDYDLLASKLSEAMAARARKVDDGKPTVYTVDGDSVLVISVAKLEDVLREEDSIIGADDAPRLMRRIMLECSGEIAPYLANQYEQDCYCDTCGFKPCECVHAGD